MSDGEPPNRKRCATYSSSIEQQNPFKQTRLDVCFELPDYLSSAIASTPAVTKSASSANVSAPLVKPSESAHYDGKDMGRCSGKTTKTSIFQTDTAALKAFRRDLVNPHKHDDIYIHMFNDKKKALQNRRKYWAEASLSEKKEMLLKIDSDVKTEMAGKDFVPPGFHKVDLKDDGYIFFIPSGKHNLMNEALESLKTFDPVVIAEAYQRRAYNVCNAKHTWAIQTTGNAAGNLKPDLAFLKEQETSMPGDSILRAVMNRDISPVVEKSPQQDLPLKRLLDSAGNLANQGSAKSATNLSTGVKDKMDEPASERAVSIHESLGATTNEAALAPSTDIKLKDSADPAKAPVELPKKSSAETKSRVFMLVNARRKGAVPASLRKLDRDSRYDAFYRVVEQELKMPKEAAQVAPKKVFKHVARSIEKVAFASAKHKADYLDKMMRVEVMLSADPDAIVVRKFDKKFPEGRIYCCTKMRNVLKVENK